jgi:rhodanese-related sulfurtransferase
MNNQNRSRIGPVGEALALSGMLRNAPRPLGEVSLGELRDKLASHDDFVFVMSMDRDRYDRAHIPGSIDLESFLAMSPGLSPDTEIIVYCTDPACAASMIGAAMIARVGFTNVRRFSGGLSAWVEAGLPLSGAMAAAA